MFEYLSATCMPLAQLTARCQSMTSPSQLSPRHAVAPLNRVSLLAQHVKNANFPLQHFDLESTLILSFCNIRSNLFKVCIILLTITAPYPQGFATRPGRYQRQGPRLEAAPRLGALGCHLFSLPLGYERIRAGARQEHEQTQDVQNSESAGIWIGVPSRGI